MRILINGQHREFTAGSTLQDVVDERNALSAGIAIAVDGELVPRTAWAVTELSPGAAVEIVTAMQGG